MVSKIKHIVFSFQLPLISCLQHDIMSQSQVPSPPGEEGFYIFFEAKQNLRSANILGNFFFLLQPA